MSNCEQHIQTVHDMLPYLPHLDPRHATSAYGYVQMILRLPETHPDANYNFMEICHVLRCTDTFLAGLSAHLIMEQGPMRNINTYGGLTREQG